MRIELKSYAKINLSLEVTGRRPDGYHNIVSLMHGVGLHDIVTLEDCGRVSEGGAESGLATAENSAGCGRAEAESEGRCSDIVESEDCGRVSEGGAGSGLATAENSAGCGRAETMSAACAKNGTKYNLAHCTIGDIVVYLCTDAQNIPMDMSNLALKGIKTALDAMRAKVLSRMPEDSVSSCGDLLVTIDKRLPVAAGIAGGSGNAAVCMLGMNWLLGSPLSLDELMAAGAGVGADVPFSILMNAYKNAAALEGLRGIECASSAAWIGGIGDIVEPAKPLGLHVILANPGIQVSTKEAYEAIDSLGDYSRTDGRRLTGEGMDGSGAGSGEGRGSDDCRSSGEGPGSCCGHDQHVAHLAGGGVAADGFCAGESRGAAGPGAGDDLPVFVNDLEKYTLEAYPEAMRLKETMEDELHADAVLMSGSGPTVAAYYRDAEMARTDYRAIDMICSERSGWRCWLTALEE